MLTNCESAKLELSCDKGQLKMHMSANSGHPDQLHSPPPLPPTPPNPHIFCRRKSPSQLQGQERQQQERCEKIPENLSSKDINVIKPAENINEDKKEN